MQDTQDIALDMINFIELHEHHKTLVAVNTLSSMHKWATLFRRLMPDRKILTVSAGNWRNLGVPVIVSDEPFLVFGTTQLLGCGFRILNQDAVICSPHRQSKEMAIQLSGRVPIGNDVLIPYSESGHMLKWWTETSLAEYIAERRAAAAAARGEANA